MHDEIELLKDNETWELVRRPEDREVQSFTKVSDPP
jgi:hypothetical protein